jgi:CheY-like chemotaxis protein
VDLTPIVEFDEDGEEDEKQPDVPHCVAPDAAILIVDDNPMNLTVIKGLLEPTMMFVSTATSGEECLEKLREGTFDVVLLDHLMPEMDGVETLEKIRKKFKDLPVYALTSTVEANGAEFYASKGFNGYLAKPIDTYLLEQAIKKHIPADIVMEVETSKSASILYNDSKET